ncbi:hypothetical protein HMN09_01085400 [Mycena chlorophos]|uniref:Uncharacterized protein n=1 Tax=Mycena chlorophos TaxID=658473 RepID=A0A8H6W1R6_MYCCL|nr:hypothetical protein HMN09_01085400 [Mycena chlorophos]
MAKSAAKPATAFALPKSVVERNSKTKKSKKAATSSKSTQPAEPNSEDELPPTITMVGTMEMRKKRAEHPGGPDMARPKRSSAEVTAAKRAVASKKAAAAQKLTDGIDTIAKIEQQSLRTQDTKVTTAANPPLATTKRKPRQVAPAREPSPSFDDIPQPKFGDGDIDIDSSDSDAYEQEPEEEESDSEMDVVSEEEEQAPPKRSKTKKANKNAVRQAVQQVREKLEPKKVAKRKAVGAVTDDDDEDRSKATKKAPTKKSRAIQPHGIRTDFIRRTSSTPRFPTTETMVKKVLQLGARQARPVLLSVLPSPVSWRTSEPDYVDPDSDTGVAIAKFKVSDVRKKDLSPKMRAAFDNEFTPTFLSYCGEQRAWGGVDESVPVALFNSLRPKDQVTLESNAGRMMIQLAKRENSNTIHAIGAGGMKIVGDELAKMSPEEIKAHVKKQLAGDDNERAGFLQSTVILRVFAIFIAATSCPGEPGPIGFLSDVPETWPVGAMTYVIQSVKRAYSAYLTGELKVPGDFSKANFEDRMFNMVDGVNKPLFRTSSIDKMLRAAVKGKQWRRIVEAARAAAKAPQEKKPAVVYDIDEMSAPIVDYSGIVDNDPDTDEELDNAVASSVTAEPGTAAECAAAA